MKADQQEFCLKWNSYHANLAVTFASLFQSDLLTDVTISCRGQTYRAHKLILAACSQKFADLFQAEPNTSPCMIILDVLTSTHMPALLEFMYKGEVNVRQSALGSFLEAAETLQIKGLSPHYGGIRSLLQQHSQQDDPVHLSMLSHFNHQYPQTSIYPQIHPMHCSPNRPLTQQDLGAPALNGGHHDEPINVCPHGGCLDATIESLQGEMGAGGGDGDGPSPQGADLNGCAAAAMAAAMNTSSISSNTCSDGSCGSCGERSTPSVSSSNGVLCPVNGNDLIMSNSIAALVAAGISVASGIGAAAAATVGAAGPVAGPITVPVSAFAGGDNNSLKDDSNCSNVVPNYVPPIYRPIAYEPLRKRAILNSPFAEQELRGSVLRDGSKGSPEQCTSPMNKSVYNHSTSSSNGSPSTPTSTEVSGIIAEPLTTEQPRPSPRGRPPKAKRNVQVIKSPINKDNSNSNSNPGNTAVAAKTSGKAGGKKGATNNTEVVVQEEENCAEDLRVKSENTTTVSPGPSTAATATTSTSTSNTSMTTPAEILESIKNGNGEITDNLVASIAPADMLAVWNAAKLSNRNGALVHTADGKKLKCLYCDRLYGYETNLRAHIRQRHQGIRVPCPFCVRTFTRNNTVRRHIAREHRTQIGLSPNVTIVSASVVAAAAAAAAAANNTQ